MRLHHQLSSHTLSMLSAVLVYLALQVPLKEFKRRMPADVLEVSLTASGEDRSRTQLYSTLGVLAHVQHAWAPYIPANCPHPLQSPHMHACASSAGCLAASPLCECRACGRLPARSWR